MFLTACQSPSQVDYIEYDETESVNETSEEDEAEDEKNRMITFDYEIGNGNKIPITFRILDVIIVIIVIVIVIAIPIIILWRKAKKLGIDDMSFDPSFTPASSSDKPAKPLLEKPVKDQSEVPFLDPRFLQKKESIPIDSQEQFIEQSDKHSVSEVTESQVSASDKNVEQPVYSPQSSFPQPLPHLSLGNESFLEGIEVLKQRSIITEKLSDIQLTLQPNALLYRDAMRREILILPRFEMAEAMNHFLNQYHEVYVVIDKANISKCQKLD